MNQCTLHSGCQCVRVISPSRYHPFLAWVFVYHLIRFDRQNEFVHIHTYVRMYVHMYVHTYVLAYYVHMYMYVHAHACMQMRMGLIS